MVHPTWMGFEYGTVFQTRSHIILDRVTKLDKNHLAVRLNHAWPVPESGVGARAHSAYFRNTFSKGVFRKQVHVLDSGKIPKQVRHLR